ncbi:unnamed protein product, partial [Acidithrix sp. C25]
VETARPISHTNSPTRSPEKIAAKVAVVDTETTGLYRDDRIVEVGIVLLDSQTCEIFDEFETLVNPGRDVGPTRIHGITASMVAAAPSFDEIVYEVADRLNGYILSAHNLAFDQRMIDSEFTRAGAIFEPGRGLCTLSLSRMRLDLACQEYGIPLKSAHRALDDARAAAQLLMRSLESGANKLLSSACEPATISLGHLHKPTYGLAITRDDVAQVTEVVRLQEAHRLEIVCDDPTLLPYLDLLGLALDDLVLTEQEVRELNNEALSLGLSPNQISLAHEQAFTSLMADVGSGNSATEIQLMKVLAPRLGINDRSMFATHMSKLSAELTPTVCFTGDIFIKGHFVERSKLEQLALAAGWRVDGTVTKKRCTLLVGDVNSQSSKMEKARQLGIKIASGDQFAGLIGL